ncbi:MAG: protein kinase [Bryobacter sp.]|nr:protein kinase [Bryobacter sp.]
MTTQDWEKISGIVREALGKPEGERGVHLAMELSEEPELLACARRLVRLAARPAHDEDFAEIQSGWRLIMPLGMDGLGMDFLAERADGTVDTLVLFKVSRIFLEDAGAQQQFTHDLRTLALLYDAGVARMLDSGWVNQGRPYVVVEFDGGQRITEAVRQWELEEKVLLFRKVLAAVQYGHLKQVLHGDLKPDNILVTNGDPRIYEFGLSRLLTTGTDSIAAQDTIDIESLAYNSPEHIRGLELSERSDIYSLGVVLYEMLLGRRPYARPGDDVLQVGRAICEKLPEKIEAVNEDLNYIVLKALEKAPAARYQTIAEFARDVQDYLDGRAVAPRREAMAEMVLRLLKQNWVTAALVVGVLSVGGIAMFYKGKAEAKADKIQAITSALFQGKGGKGAANGASTIQSAKKYLDDMLEQNMGNIDVVDNLSSAYLQLAEVERQGTGLLRGNRGAAIQSVRKSYELSLQVLEAKGATEDKLKQYAKSAKMLTEMLTEARDYKEALKVALDWKEKLAKLDSQDPEFLAMRAAADQAAADLLYLSGEKQAALPPARSAMQQFKSIFDKDPANEESGRNYARSASSVGTKAAELRLFPEAIFSFNTAADVLRPQATKKDSKVVAVLDLAKTLNGLGDTLAKTEQPQKARASFLEARQLLEQAAKREKNNDDLSQILADNYMRTARLGREINDFTAAISETDRAVELLRRLVDTPGSRAEFRRDLAMALTIKGEILLAQGKKAIAREFFEEARSLWQLYSNLSVLKPDEEAEFNRLKNLV